MAEQFRSITEARKELPTLAETVEGGGDRVVITNQGKPQAVLLGYDDFRGLLAAAEFLNRPDDLARLRRGLADTSRMSFGELREWIAARRAEKNIPIEPSAAPAPAPVEITTIAQLEMQLHALNRGFSVRGSLRTILEHMRRFADAELCTLFLLDESRQELRYAIAAGQAQEKLRRIGVKVGEGFAGWVAERGETLIVPEAFNDPRAKGPEADALAAARSLIALPLRGRKGTQGVIEILNPRAEMSDYIIAFLHILADHASMAIENGRDVARIQQLTFPEDTTEPYAESVPERLAKPGSAIAAEK